jgi:IS66 orf2 family protein
MFNYDNYRVNLSCGATDMRKSINGLAEIVYSNFKLDPRDKIIFAFCNNLRDRINLLVWEDNGFWIHFKGLEKGHVVWSSQSDTEITMDLLIDDLKNIIMAPGIKQKIKRSEVFKKC